MIIVCDGLQITGAGGALGRELALCFAREGCRVTCVDVTEAECEETRRLVSQVSPHAAENVRSMRLDVTDRAAVVELVKSLPPVDVLVNNAGIVQAGGLLDVTDQQITAIIDVNLMAHFWVRCYASITMAYFNTLISHHLILSWPYKII